MIDRCEAQVPLGRNLGSKEPQYTRSLSGNGKNYPLPPRPPFECWFQKIREQRPKHGLQANACERCGLYASEEW